VRAERRRIFSEREQGGISYERGQAGCHTKSLWPMQPEASRPDKPANQRAHPQGSGVRNAYKRLHTHSRIPPSVRGRRAR
jgi:hypothetical protein